MPLWLSDGRELLLDPRLPDISTDMRDMRVHGRRRTRPRAGVIQESVDGAFPSQRINEGMHQKWRMQNLRGHTRTAQASVARQVRCQNYLFPRICCCACDLLLRRA